MKKFSKAAATGLLLLSLSNPAWAGHPPLDRPTPPPCCADGHCLANPLTSGYYPTRWRRWPLEVAQQVPSAAAGQPIPVPPGELDFPVIAPPPATEEDRKAPPPSTPSEEPLRAAPTTGAPGSETRTAPSGPVTPAPPAIPGGPLVPPAGPGERTTVPRTLPPYQPQSRPTGTGGPTSDADPPPALPFAMPPTVASQQPMPQPAVARPAAQITSPGSQLPPAYQPMPTAPPAPAQSPSGDDPPPSLPGTLAGLAN